MKPADTKKTDEESYKRGTRRTQEGLVVGQHRIQKQILRSFSFEGRQLNSREVWCLKANYYRPESRSIGRVGFFEVDCSEGIDQYITVLENKFKEPLRRFSNGEFGREDIGREIYDFIAMHYVRSQACRHQINHMVDECCRRSMLTPLQAQAEYRRLASYQDEVVFRDLVDSVSRVLTHFVLCPIEIISPQSFVTSDKIMYAGKVDSKQRVTLAWFPLSPSTGLYIESDSLTGQLLGPTKVNRQIGQIELLKLCEAQWLRCQKPSRQKVSAEFINILNGLMVKGSTELYAADRAAIDTTLEFAEQPSGYQYPVIANDEPG